MPTRLLKYRMPQQIGKKESTKEPNKEFKKNLKKNIIIGVDPGTRITGYGIIVSKEQKHSVIDYGCIRPPAKLELSDRYHIIYKGIKNLLDLHAPVALAVETQYVKKNIQSALKLGMVRGVIIIAAKEYGIPIFEYAPTKAKLAVVGTGQASKEQVQSMVKMLLNLSKIPTPEDAADALSLAICHAQSQQNSWMTGKIL